MSGTGGGLGAAEARLDSARLALSRAAADDWRSTAARGFAARLAEHQAACGAAHGLLEHADAALRRHQAALAAARIALAPGAGPGLLLSSAGGGEPGAGWWPGRTGGSGASR